MIDAMVMASFMFPYVGPGDGFVQRVTDLIESDDVLPVIRARVLECVDRLTRMQRARSH
jgi:hypothetical protein